MSESSTRNPLRVAIIGMGPIGNLHADVYRSSPLAELCGVCDIRRDRAEAAAARLGVRAFVSAPAMLHDLSPDLVSVTTGGYEYGSDHCRPTLEALEAGCHVLCEKPLSNEVADAERMVAAAKERGLCLGTNFNHRQTAMTRKAKEWVEEGRLGDLLFVSMSMWIGKKEESSPYYHLKALHPHSFDTLRHFGGDIDAVQCFAVKAPGRSIWSTAEINLRFRSGVVGHLTGSYDIPRGHPMERTEVAGTRGRFVLEDMFDQLTFFPSDSDEKTVITNTVFGGSVKTFQDTFRARITRFLEQLHAGTAPDAIDGSGYDGLMAQRAIDAAIRSLETGEVVRV